MKSINSAGRCCVLVGLLGATVAAQPSRMLFIPQGTDPSEADAFVGSPFPFVTDPGQVITVEAYLQDQNTLIAEYAVQWDCISTSSNPGAADITYVANSAGVDNLRPDWVFSGVPAFPAID